MRSVIRLDERDERVVFEIDALCPAVGDAFQQESEGHGVGAVTGCVLDKDVVAHAHLAAVGNVQQVGLCLRTARLRQATLKVIGGEDVDLCA